MIAELAITNTKQDLPTSFVGEAIAHTAHRITNGCPFRTTDDPNVLDTKDCKEQVFVCSVVPVLVHIERVKVGSWLRWWWL